MKKVFLVHGWQSSPEKGILPWLKTELTNRGFEVSALSMPESEYPKIETWVPYLQEKIKNPDEDTILFGHSIGCQAILRYIQTLTEEQKIGGAVLLAGWLHLKDKAYEVDEDLKIARPWLETPLDWEYIKSKADNFVCIFSDNDPLVPLSDAQIFEEKLGAKIIIEKDKKHFEDKRDIKELPSVLVSILKIAGIAHN